MTSSVFAGGYESNALSTSFMYEQAGEMNAYAEVAYGSRSYDVTGTTMLQLEVRSKIKRVRPFP